MTAELPEQDPQRGPSPVRGHRRGRDWAPVTYGVHRRVAPDPPSEGEHTPIWSDGDLAGWQLLLPGDGCFTGLTALDVWEIDLPTVPEACPVFVAMGKNDPRPLRTGVHTSRHVRPVPHVEVRGLRVATVPEALVAAARWVGQLDLVCIVDNALHKKRVTLDELYAVGASRRPGAKALRDALPLVDARAESLPESMLRLLHVVCGIEVEPQWIVEVDGVEVARCDIWLVGTESVHEYDGGEHEKTPRRVKDLRRVRRLDEAGLVRRGYTMGDLVARPVTILRDADRAVGRVHDPSRIRPWNELLRDSLRTPAGSDAFLQQVPSSHRARRPSDKVAADHN